MIVFTVVLCMMLTEKINSDMKQAMLARDTIRLETLRSIRAGILEFEKSGADRAMTDDDEFKILNAAAKKRKDAIEQYERAGRSDAAEKERAELAIIMEYLPEQLSESDVKNAIATLVAEMGAVSSADFGKVMGAAMKTLKGKADGAVIQRIVKEMLG